MTFTVNQHVTVPPDVDDDTAPWWKALSDGTLLVPRCNSCERAFFPPTPSCPHCGSRDVGDVVGSGHGAVYSWIVVHHALDPLFADETTYTIAAVVLDEGARVFGRIANGPLDDGTPVRAVPYVVDGTTLLGFERA
jgi:uncharacterized OB-fold protein